MLSPHATPADGGATLARLKAGVRAERAALPAKFREMADGARVLREHRRLVDRVLKEMWRQLRLPAPLALLAVGGYGRGELHPHSGIDVLVLLQEPASPRPARGRGLRPRGALSSFRHRRAGSAAGAGCPRLREPDRKTHRTR